MKKKGRILIIVAVFIVITGIYFSQPQKIIENPSLLEINSVYLTTENAEQKDITEQVDLEALAEILAKHECNRYRTPSSNYLIASITYEINGNYEDKPIHILVGERNRVYESADKGGYLIKNGAALLEDLDTLVQRK